MSGNVGFVGLGSMGGPFATNLVAKGFTVVAYDAAGTAERAPQGSRPSGSVAEVAQAAETIFLSVPDGPAVLSVAADIIAAPGICRKVVDLSTIGVEAAREANAKLGAAGIAYLDAPVSGGRAGAIAGTVAVMCAGPRALYDSLADELAGISSRVFHVGDAPGQGQALKLLNNFLSATAMYASSEAVAFGLSAGLDFKMILDVVKASTGQNTAINDRFPKSIMTEKYDVGFTNTLMSKDVSLYLAGAKAAGTPHRAGALIEAAWREFRDADPGVDYTRVFPYLTKGTKPQR